MTTRTSDLHAQAGAISVISLSALGGFAAGALLAGALALLRHPAGSAAEGGPGQAQYHAPPVATERPAAYEPASSSPAAAVQGPWHFEAATPPPPGGPGPHRPDRLSAPEGWTPEPAGPGPH